MLYETWDVDSLGRETLTHRKSGVDTWRGFDKANGRLVYLNTYKGATNLQELSIAYDPIGNVAQPRDHASTCRRATRCLYHTNSVAQDEYAQQYVIFAPSADNPEYPGGGRRGRRSGSSESE